MIELLNASLAPFFPSFIVVVQDRTTGADVIVHEWASAQVAERDLQLLQKALDTMDVTTFHDEYGLRRD